MRSLRQTFCVVLACLVALGGCSTEIRKNPPLQLRPVDRDEKTVDAALGAFDFCKLLNLGVY
jgi:uncharacterized protein YceK